MAQQYYYKVVGRDMCSFLNTRYDDVIYGDIYKKRFEPWKVEYKENEWIYPKVEKTKLYVFKILNDAKSFIKMYPYTYFIYKCEIKNPSKANMVDFCDILNFATFWKRFLNKKKYTNFLNKYDMADYNSVACDAIKLIERIPT